MKMPVSTRRNSTIDTFPLESFALQNNIPDTVDDLQVWLLDSCISKELRDWSRKPEICNYLPEKQYTKTGFISRIIDEAPQNRPSILPDEITLSGEDGFEVDGDLKAIKAFVYTTHRLLQSPTTGKWRFFRRYRFKQDFALAARILEEIWQGLAVAKHQNYYFEYLGLQPRNTTPEADRRINQVNEEVGKKEIWMMLLSQDRVSINDYRTKKTHRIIQPKKIKNLKAGIRSRKISDQAAREQMMLCIMVTVTSAIRLTGKYTYLKPVFFVNLALGKSKSHNRE